jgi:hypothetical protein
MITAARRSMANAEAAKFGAAVFANITPAVVSPRPDRAQREDRSRSANPNLWKRPDTFIRVDFRPSRFHMPLSSDSDRGQDHRHAESDNVAQEP